jgi:hypothetical protein
MYKVIKKKTNQRRRCKFIGDVVADFMQINVQCMGVDNLWSKTLFDNKSYLMNFTRWNYNCAFYYYRYSYHSYIRKNGYLIYQLYCQTRRH